MNGTLKNTKAGWFVLYQVMRDELSSGYDSIQLHPDSQTWMDGYNLYEGKEVEFELVMDKPEHRYSLTPYAKIINKDDLGCSYPDCICQGNEIIDCKNRTPDQVILGDKTALVEDIFYQGLKKTAMQELIDEIVEHLTYDDDLTDNSRITLETIRLRCFSKLTKEKEQIIDAHTEGYVIGGGNGDLYNCKQYYNETYGK